VNVLGINCFSHDTSACLLRDGAPIAFGEQERFNRDQHTTAFPEDAVAYCLASAGVRPSQLDAVAFAHRSDLDLARGAIDALARGSARRLAAQAFVDVRLRSREAAFRSRWAYRGPAFHVGHHDAHAASAFFPSPFEEAAVLTLDRGGDFLSTTLGRGRGSRLERLGHVRNPHSLGEVYSALTWYLGFRPNADEGKVMGLAPYGRNRLCPGFRDLVRLTPEGRFKVNLSWFAYQRERGWLSSRFLETYGPPRRAESEIADRHEDLAYAVQDLVEQAGLHVARALRRLTGSRRLCLAGGVALNSVMNSRLLQEAGFDDLFIQPAASDAGNALGAALWVWHHRLGQPRRWRIEHPFLGPAHDLAAYRRALEVAGVPFRETKDPAGAAAALLDEGKVVGWFQGRAEMGPRALGNRSILADPRRAEMRDIVNHRVKRREGFRPFAPAVLHRRGPEWFERYHPNPFMLLVLPIRADKRALIPAVTHVDGTGRLQSVTPEFNAGFHEVIVEFERRTGVPVVLNTSFNLRGEPMVLRPEEAVADFLRSGLDALFLGPYLAEKHASWPQMGGSGPLQGPGSPIPAR
jgi:carbamoyltransferase